MTITLNHTIVFVRDKKESSKFLTELFGLPPPSRSGRSSPCKWAR